MAAREKNENEDLRGGNEKGARKTEKNHIKTGGKALKCIFLGYKLKRKTVIANPA